MKTAGIIVEYNPLHNGHLYHIKETKKISNADYIVAVMSGDFVQRGAPAIMDKYSRAYLALMAGADVVFELPVRFSLSSAEGFAQGAISLLDGLGFVDSFCFGSESGEISIFKELAPDFLEETQPFKQALHSCLSEGLSYPKARSEAFKKAHLLKGNIITDDLDIFLSSPNNILGLEYEKARLRLKSPLVPFTIKRKGSGYHDISLGDFSSASAIRTFIERKDSLVSDLNHCIPDFVSSLLESEYSRGYPVTADDFSLLLQYRLLGETRESLAQYLDISNDLANRIMNSDFSGQSFSMLSQQLKTKQLTLTRVQRCLFHLLLNLKKESVMMTKNSLYARLLGMKKEAGWLLRDGKQKCRIPIVTKVADGLSKLNGEALTMLKEDIYAASLYEQVVSLKFRQPYLHELRRGIRLL